MVISDLLFNGSDMCVLNRNDIDNFPSTYINIIDSLEKYGAESKDKMHMIINRSL